MPNQKNNDWKRIKQFQAENDKTAIVYSRSNYPNLDCAVLNEDGYLLPE